MGKQFVVNVHLDKLGASFYGEPAEPKKKVGLWSKLLLRHKPTSSGFPYTYNYPGEESHSSDTFDRVGLWTKISSLIIRFFICSGNFSTEEGGMSIL